MKIANISELENVGEVASLRAREDGNFMLGRVIENYMLVRIIAVAILRVFATGTQRNILGVVNFGLSICFWGIITIYPNLSPDPEIYPNLLKPSLAATSSDEEKKIFFFRLPRSPPLSTGRLPRSPPLSTGRLPRFPPLARGASNGGVLAARAVLPLRFVLSLSLSGKISVQQLRLHELFF